MWRSLTKLILLLMVLQALKEQMIDAERIRRVYDGKKANWTNFNFVVAVIVNVERKWGGHCTGSLIASDLVITSAHCFFDKSSEDTDMIQVESRYVKVAGGEQYWDKDTDKSFWRDVSTILVHEEYESFKSDCDIALVLLKNHMPVDGKELGVVKYNDKPPVEWALCEAAGWGVYFKDLLPKELRSGAFVVLPRDHCHYHFGVTSKNFLCGLSLDRSSVCSGDSGGPLVCEGKLSGIIDSSGLNCTMPNLFTNIAYFKKWIERGHQLSVAPTLAFRYFKLSASFLNFVFVYLLYIW